MRDAAVFDAVEEQVHPADRGGSVVELLPVELEAARSLPCRFTSAAAEMSMPAVPAVGS